MPIQPTTLVPENLRDVIENKGFVVEFQLIRGKRLRLYGLFLSSKDEVELNIFIVLDILV
jgi:hypothetical protein